MATFRSLDDWEAEQASGLTRCDGCGRTTWKRVRDVLRSHDWTRTVVNGVSVTLCGSCNQKRHERLALASGKAK